jgi:hypothetical protein
MGFLIESRAGLVSLRSRRKMRTMNEIVNVLGPTRPQANEVRSFILSAYLRDGQGLGIRPLYSVSAKGAESGVKGRQIRRPFHSDYDLLRTRNR